MEVVGDRVGDRVKRAAPSLGSRLLTLKVATVSARSSPPSAVDSSAGWVLVKVPAS